MNSFADVLPVLGSLLMIVLVLMLTWYLTRWYAKKTGNGITGRNIKIVDKAGISNTSSLIVAQVCGKYYLIGASDHGVSLLKELEDYTNIQDTGANVIPFQKLFSRLVNAGSKNTGDGFAPYTGTSSDNSHEAKGPDNSDDEVMQ